MAPWHWTGLPVVVAAPTSDHPVLYKIVAASDLCKSGSMQPLVSSGKTLSYEFRPELSDYCLENALEPHTHDMGGLEAEVVVFGLAFTTSLTLVSMADD